MKIESGTGNGYYAGIDSQNRLRTASVSSTEQHAVSSVTQKAFQVIGEATAVNGVVNVLHIKNSTADQTYTLTYMRMSNIDLAGGTAVPNAANYFELGTGMSYNSGGSAAEAVNVYVGSTVLSGGIFYKANPTLTGTFVPIDKHWPNGDADEHFYDKKGSLMVPPGQTLTLRYTGDHTSGTLYTRFSFYVSPISALSL
jgi:hypothetical protein